MIAPAPWGGGKTVGLQVAPQTSRIEINGGFARKARPTAHPRHTLGERAGQAAWTCPLGVLMPTGGREPLL